MTGEFGRGMVAPVDRNRGIEMNVEEMLVGLMLAQRLDRGSQLAYGNMSEYRSPNLVASPGELDAFVRQQQASTEYQAMASAMQRYGGVAHAGVAEWRPRTGETTRVESRYHPTGEAAYDAVAADAIRLGYTPRRWWQWWRWTERSQPWLDERYRAAKGDRP